MTTSTDKLDQFRLTPAGCLVATWQLGDRKVTCSVADRDLTEVTGSLEGSRR